MATAKVDEVRGFLSQQINATKQSDEAFFEGWSDEKIFAFLCVKYYLANDDAAPADIEDCLMEKDGKVFAICNYAKNGSEDAPTLAFFDYTVATSIGGDFCAFPQKIVEIITSDGILSEGDEKEIKTRWEEVCGEATEEDDATKKLLFYFTGITPLQNATKLNANATLKRKIAEEFSCQDICFGREIKAWISSAQSGDGRIPQGEIKIDSANNILSYHNSDEECGIVVNLSAKSLQNLYGEHGKNLLGLNLRYHVNGKTVDSGIKTTMSEHSAWFWCLNNGVVIVCDDYEIEGNADGNGTVKLTNFSVVNGGQTTFLISKMKENAPDFFFVCKIVKMGCERALKGLTSTAIAVASNAQKPIKAKDLRSNGEEQNKLKAWMQQRNLQYIVKQGEKVDREYKDKISLEVLGKLILASILQMPWTKSNTKCLYEEPYYNLIFGAAGTLPQAVNCYPDIIEANKIYKSFNKSDDADAAGTDIVRNCRTAALAATVLISWYFQNGKTFPVIPDAFDKTAYARFYENFLLMNRIFSQNIQGQDRQKKTRRLFSWLASGNFRYSIRNLKGTVANLTKTEGFYLDVLSNLKWNLESCSFFGEFEELFA